jgi:hypothetical protein
VQYAPPKYGLVFSETFDGTLLDQWKWTYRTGATYYASLLPEEVTVASGYMSLNTDAKNLLRPEVCDRRDHRHGSLSLVGITRLSPR